jgi:hypothetical protein
MHVRLFSWRLSLRIGIFAGLFFFSLAPGAALAASIKLAWDANSESDISGYGVSYRSEDGQHQGLTMVGKTTQATISRLHGGQRYTFHVVAYNSVGLASGPSAEVSGVPTGADQDDPGPIPTDGTKTYFAEGAAGIFSYRLALLNTTSAETSATVSFLRENDSPVQRVYNLPALTRVTVSASDVPELANTSFGTILSTGPGVVAERTMGWDVGGQMAGGHTAKAIVSPSQTWFLAEGNAGFFDTFILLVNPQNSPTNTTVDFLLDDGQVVSRSFDIPALGRQTIYANQIPELVTRSFATTVHASQPILCERAMYFKNGDTMFRGGHSSAAVPSGATHWFLAEGQTGAFFETFVLLANPNPNPVDVTVRYLTNNGVARTDQMTLAPTSRATIVADEIPEIAETDVSFDISATGPIIAERSMYWGPWYGAHNSMGVTDLGTKWALAEGEVGGPFGANSYILLANPGGQAADVTLTFYREGGAAPLTLTRTVQPGTRVTVQSSDAGFGAHERFGAIIDSTQPIAVERSIYWNEGGAWGSGTNETGTRLQ